jgi:hypothetical protein
MGTITVMSRNPAARSLRVLNIGGDGLGSGRAGRVRECVSRILVTHVFFWRRWG